MVQVKGFPMRHLWLARCVRIVDLTPCLKSLRVHHITSICTASTTLSATNLCTIHDSPSSHHTLTRYQAAQKLSAIVFVLIDRWIMERVVFCHTCQIFIINVKVDAIITCIIERLSWTLTMSMFAWQRVCINAVHRAAPYSHTGNPCNTCPNYISTVQTFNPCTNRQNV